MKRGEKTCIACGIRHAKRVKSKGDAFVAGVQMTRLVGELRIIEMTFCERHTALMAEVNERIIRDMAREIDHA